MNASMPEYWLLITGLITLLVGVLGFFASSVFDQIIRNRVDEHMYGYALRELLPMGIDDYQVMPIHWRQVITELSIRRKVVGDTESKVLFATLEHFDVNQLHLVDKIAPYMMFDFLVRDPSRTDTQHPISSEEYFLRVRRRISLTNFSLLLLMMRLLFYKVNLSEVSLRNQVNSVSYALTGNSDTMF